MAFIKTIKSKPFVLPSAMPVGTCVNVFPAVPLLKSPGIYIINSIHAIMHIRTMVIAVIISPAVIIGMVPAFSSANFLLKRIINGKTPASTNASPRYNSHVSEKRVSRIKKNMGIDEITAMIIVYFTRYASAPGFLNIITKFEMNV